MIGRAMLRPLATARITARFASTAPMLPKARLAFPRAALAAAAAAATGERRPRHRAVVRMAPSVP